MDERFRNTVYETLADIFGIMFFIPIEPLTGPPPRKMWNGVEGIVLASLDVTGIRNHSVSFYFPKELARNVAINFMGIDESAINESRELDAVKEAANMAVGSLLGRVDPRATLKLGIPQGRIVEDFSPGGLLENPDICVYETEYGYLWIDFDEISEEVS
ncbi:MAG: chemotaxis protein CheX [Proteobacteria bacterium]|nr:chemotaxis protein CheX [Pseudomonadota bacterium]MBU1686178.1 chemotaxis protein CheX [Pseudomonadota bacterium]